MPAFSPFAVKAMLDWICGGATATRPPERWLGLLNDAGELTCGGYTRQSATFAEAASPGAVASLAAACTFGSLSVAGPTSVLSCGIYDGVNGNQLFAGTMATPRVFGNGDSYVLNVLSVSLI
jgi:hypothetical protein